MVLPQPSRHKLLSPPVNGPLSTIPPQAHNARKLRAKRGLQCGALPPPRPLENRPSPPKTISPKTNPQSHPVSSPSRALPPPPLPEPQRLGASRRGLRKDVLLTHDPRAEEPAGHGVDRRPPRAQDQEAAD